MEYGLMDDKETIYTIREKVWEECIEYVLDIINDMKYNRAYYDIKTLEELEQRIV
jgi:hypothetical protein